MYASGSSASDFRRFLLGTLPTADDLKITGSRLPTKKQTLLCFLAHREASTNKREASNSTVDEVHCMIKLGFRQFNDIKWLKKLKSIIKYLKIF